MQTFNINEQPLNISKMRIYQKKKIILHVIYSTDIGEVGDSVCLTTLEGEVTITVGNDNYIMIGADNEVYPIKKDLFESKYRIVSGKKRSPIDLSSVISNLRCEGDVVQECKLFVNSFVYAEKLSEPVCIITKNNYGAVLNGKRGDYLVRSYEDEDNVYIINSKLMRKTYKLVKV